MADYQIKTKHGYEFFEVASAFQKAVRRCEETLSMQWAVELYESGYQKYAWKRMIIMASEDVGLGEPDCITRMMALKASYDFLLSLNDKHKPEKLPFTQAVLVLVNSRKSRYVDLAISVYWKLNETERPEVPDYVFDMHTRKGKMMGRGLDHFYSEGAKVNNANKLPNEEYMESLAKRADKSQNISKVEVEEVKREEPRTPNLFEEESC